MVTTQHLIYFVKMSKGWFSSACMLFRSPWCDVWRVTVLVPVFSSWILISSLNVSVLVVHLFILRMGNPRREDGNGLVRRHVSATLTCVCDCVLGECCACVTFPSVSLSLIAHLCNNSYSQMAAPCYTMKSSNRHRCSKVTTGCFWSTYGHSSEVSCYWKLLLVFIRC